jgi:RNA polymerase sigma factor (sigma-70 family)
MQGLRQGDEHCFEAIFKRHHAPLLSYCRHMLGNREEAEDALQQAFIRAHRALLGASPPRELRPWLYAIARNCCLSAIAARRPTGELYDGTPSLVGLTDEVHERQDLRDLVGDIGRLPEDQRSALLLSELEDLDHRAIATIVGCPVSKVKALIYQARTTLIAERAARESPCQEIRERLAVARGGELRRGSLRRHLNICPGCRDFQSAIAAQRQSLASVLPVLPSAGLAAQILGHGLAGGATVGIGAGAVGTGGTGATTLGTAGVLGGAGTVGAAATTGGSASFGALVGGGLVGKLAVGGAVAVLAAAGAAGVPAQLVHALPSQRGRSGLSAAPTGIGAGTPSPLAQSSIGHVGLTASASLLGSPAQAPLSFTAAPTTPGDSAPSGDNADAAQQGARSIRAAGGTPGRALRAQRHRARRILRHRLAREAALRKHKAAIAQRKAAERRRKAAVRRKAAARRRAAARHRAAKAAARRRQAAQAAARRRAAKRREAAANRKAQTQRPHRAAQPATSGSTAQSTATTVAQRREARRLKAAELRKARAEKTSSQASPPTSGSGSPKGGAPGSIHPTKTQSPSPPGEASATAGTPKARRKGAGQTEGGEAGAGAGPPAGGTAGTSTPTTAPTPGSHGSHREPGTAREATGAHTKQTAPEEAESESTQASNLRGTQPVTPVDANN